MSNQEAWSEAIKTVGREYIRLERLYAHSSRERLDTTSEVTLACMNTLLRVMSEMRSLAFNAATPKERIEDK